MKDKILEKLAEDIPSMVEKDFNGIMDLVILHGSMNTEKPNPGDIDLIFIGDFAYSKDYKDQMHKVLARMQADYPIPFCPLFLSHSDLDNPIIYGEIKNGKPLYQQKEGMKEFIENKIKRYYRESYGIDVEEFLSNFKHTRSKK